MARGNKFSQAARKPCIFNGATHMQFAVTGRAATRLPSFISAWAVGYKRPSLRLNLPRLGKHTDALLTEAGYTDKKILAMHEAPIAKTD